MSANDKVNNLLKNEDDEFSELFYEFLQREGRILPQTIEEVKKAEDEGVEVEFSELPPELQNPRAVFERKRKFELRFKSLDDSFIEEDEQIFRRAARHGQELTPEIVAKMKQDRAQAEREAQSENGNTDE